MKNALIIFLKSFSERNIEDVIFEYYHLKMSLDVKSGPFPLSKSLSAVVVVSCG